jgi:integrase
MDIAQRDRLVLMALVLTGLRRSELIAVRWDDVILEGERASLLVHRGKGGRPRRQQTLADRAGLPESVPEDRLAGQEHETA